MMENFIVSARKYRPDTFDSVIGQSSITQTLKNAIKNNHLAQAYLFCGPRGIGKTTCARILAKTLNCDHVTDNVEACNECESCKAFNEGRSYNIHELDAASNNSVDDIRNLIEQVRIPPQIGRYSIYIIDEVHMLSAQAFNAFLKTLEEPPEHAIFILATTEKHKIIPTILSRCQIYDFHRISVQDIISYLDKICKSENIACEEQALNMIAQKADGAMRDALSIFDQIVSFSGKSIEYKAVIENLNILDADYYFNMVDAFLKNDISQAMIMFDEILQNGFDEKVFIGGLSLHFRDLLVSKDKQTLKLLEVGETLREKYLAQTADCPDSFLLKALAVLNKCDISFNASQNKRLHVELALVSLAQLTAEKKKDEPAASIEKSKPDSKQEAKKPVVDKPLATTEKKTVEQPDESKTDKPEVKTEGQEKPDQHNESFSKKIKNDISIKAIHEDDVLTKEEKNVEEPAAEENIYKENIKQQEEQFNHEQLIEKWNAFAESVKQEKKRLYSMLIGKTPILENDYNVCFDVNNTLQEEEINSIRSQLLHYLKKELRNCKIQLNVVLKEEISAEQQKYYTDNDKYDHLSKKNPNLDKLKKEFNLDFE